MKIREDILNGVLILIAALLIYAFFMKDARAWNPHHEHTETHVIELQPVVTYETQVTELVNTTNIERYALDECQGVAEAQAAGNNQMHVGTKHAQMSLAGGWCGANTAHSLMGGIKINNQMFINGSWGYNWYTEVHSAGAGFLVIFK